MAKLINILAASVGGGLILGAGIRLIETMAPPAAEAPVSPERLLNRLELLEDRLTRVENGTGFHAPVSDGGAIDPAALRTCLEFQQAEVEAIRTQISGTETGFGDPNRNGDRFRTELRSWMEESVNRRIAAIEDKLRADIEASQVGMLDAFVESVQQRVMHRVSRLEDEVAGQSAAMSELRECSLQTERSMQKLLEGIDRLVGAQTRNAALAEVSRPAAVPSPAPAPEPPVIQTREPAHESIVPEDRPRARRWGLFA